MKKLLLPFALLCALVIAQPIAAQTNEEKAVEKTKEAVQLMDNGQIDQSLKLLEEAMKLNPDDVDIPYEMAYAHYLNKNYKKSIDIVKKLVDRKDINDRVFQLLGNAYDMDRQQDKALDTYEKGLKKFPASGRLFLEKGIVLMAKEDYNKALTSFEKGIEAQPAFPSNYYWAAKLYCNSTEEVWGMIYGEIFMNIERGSKRTAEISKLLYDTYKREIKVTSDTSFSVSFSKNATISLSDLSDPAKFKLPFGIGLYEPLLITSLVTEKEININSLDRIRQNFTKFYFQNGNEKKYPNILFSYQNEMLKAGHLEAYNHWVLLKGDEEGFTKWQNENKSKWEEFIKWFSDNPLKVDENNTFHRSQY